MNISEISDGYKKYPEQLQIDNSPAFKVKMSKLRIIKNCCVVGCSVMLFLCGFNTCSELQSSIHITNGLGTYSQTAFTASSVVALIILPPFVISKIGLKYSIVFSLVMACPYYLANFYANFGTMIPGAILTGLFSNTIWSSKGTYLTYMAERYSVAFGTALDATLSLLFGIFYSFYYFGYIWGNVLSFMILKPDKEEILNEEKLSKCGSHFCDSYAKNDSHFAAIPNNEIYILFGSFISSALLAALIVVLFLDPIELPIKPKESNLKLILKTLKAFLDWKQLLVLPMGIHRGIMAAFLASEFTKAFVTCSWGIQYVGLVMIVFGVSCGLSSFFLGRLVRWTGRFPIFTLAFIIHIAVAVIIQLVKPRPENSIWFFVVSGLLGICNAAWESQVAGIYGIVFPDEKEVAFSIYAVSENIGGLIAYGYSASLCLQAKFAIFMTMVILAYTSYLVTELLLIRRPKKLLTNSQTNE